MRTRRLMLAAVTVLLVGPTLQAQVPQDAIHCLGTESGGGGLRLYHYDIFNGEPIPLTDLYVGTDDLNQANYGNWMMPPGWTVALLGGGGGFKNPGLKTPHGVVAPPPGGLSAGVIHWNVGQGQPINPGAVASFGYDNENLSQNVDWWTAPQGNIAPGANWLSPVGTGKWGVWTDGPVHSPVPEPATLSLLALGGLILMRSELRRRR